MVSISYKAELTPPVGRVLPQIQKLLLSTQHPDEGCEVPVRRAAICPIYAHLLIQRDLMHSESLRTKRHTISATIWHRRVSTRSEYLPHQTFLRDLL